MMVFHLFSYRGLTTVLSDLTNERSEAGEQNYGLNFIWTTHWNTQVNIFEITSGHHSLHNFEAYLINYKRLSLDSRVLARGANYIFRRALNGTKIGVTQIDKHTQKIHANRHAPIMGKKWFLDKKLIPSISLPVPTSRFQIIIEYLSLQHLAEAW